MSAGGRGYGPEQWDRANVDPSAGVRRMPRCTGEPTGEVMPWRAE